MAPSSLSSVPTSPPPAGSAAAYEANHVQAIYQRIAPHFSATRHKPWPAVTRFLAAVTPGSVGLDVGCGNGKYLGEQPMDAYLVGSDFSDALVRLARIKTRTSGATDVVAADGLCVPFVLARADFAICIAVVHHLSTRERRVEAVRQLLGCVRKGGRVLVYVWALEQGSSRRGWNEGDAQDLLVPWVIKTQERAGSGKETETEAGNETGTGKQGKRGPDPAEERSAAGDVVVKRYYHLYRNGELEEDVRAAGGDVIESGYERDNWWVVTSPGR